MATGRTATALRTSCTPLAQVTEPKVYAPSAASTRVIVTVKSALAPAARVSVAGFTETVVPGGATAEAVHVPAAPTLVTRRVTVWEPASAPTAMEGWLRSLGSMVMLGQYEARSSPVPHRYDRNWSKPTS